MELLQIEEPGQHRDELEDAGVAIALELTDQAIRLAASVGGNAEVIRNETGGSDFLPALAGYDEAGLLTAGRPGLTDLSAIGLDVLAEPDDVDRRGARATDRVARLVRTVGRQLVQRTGRPIAGAVVIVPLDSTAGLRLTLMQTVEAGGIPVLRLVESSVALALGGGLDRRSEGEYVHLAVVTDGLAVARLQVTGGTVRLVGGVLARHPDEAPRLILSEGPVLGLIAPGLDAAKIAAEVKAPLLDSFGGADRALIGAALLAEAAD